MYHFICYIYPWTHTAIHGQIFMCLLFANWHLSHALPSYPTVPLICQMSYVEFIPDLLSMRKNSRSIFSFGTTALYFIMRTLYNVTNSQRCQYLRILTCVMYLTVFISKLICVKANITVCWASGMLRKSSRIPSSCIFVWRFLVSMQFMCYNQGMNLMKNIRLMYIKVAFSNRHFLLSYDSKLLWFRAC